ncbi:hypothetical protein HMN09_00893000 [Mycena chlorophos]|uniref:(2E,6E)-farnesyl diphosphate synthase n=1 Tax=Mycena chlorophos TaxID=658473 RepID=A0A8H6SMM9_MYCCL|nr:hypothetical protein HMN09_00893000 [Mycena chlorophos]
MSLYDNILSRLSTASAQWPAEQEERVLAPYTYLTQIPGKDSSGKVLAAFNTWINAPQAKLQHISKILAMLHDASLMIDDIEDQSPLRRGQPVAHQVYGVPQTINSANYVYFLAYQEILSLITPNSTLSPVELMSSINAELLSLHRGQGLDLFWRDTFSCPSEEEYITMVNDKTSGLLRAGVKLLQACGTTNLETDYMPLVNLIGVFYQIRDDYSNLRNQDYTSQKGFAEDLTEGKFSFPVVHDILQKRPKTPTLKIQAISYLDNRTKSFEYTRLVLRKIEGQIRAEMERLGGNEGLKVVMDYLVATIAD